MRKQRNPLRSPFARLLTRVSLVLVVVGTAVGGVALWANTATWAAAVDEGYIDFRYGSQVPNRGTADKPESKLWFNDGLWWGSLFNETAQEYRIYRFDLPSQTWSDTGVAIDNRAGTLSDALWVASTQKLYVVSHLYVDNGASSSRSSDWGRLYRYSYNAASKTYSLDSGFPVTVTRGKSETLTIARDSTGKLWVTYVEGSKVMVNRTLGSDTTWGTPYVLPVTDTSVSSDDISAVIAFQGNKIGVVWSNQLTSGMYMAIHNDGAADTTWTKETIAQGSNQADDHINLKTDSTGRVFVAAKTGMRGSNPLIVLYVRSAAGSWSQHTVWIGDDYQTRPIVMLDEENQLVHVFAASDGDQQIFRKTSNINSISFIPGAGELFISDPLSLNVNDPSSTKQNVTSATGLLVIAGNRVNKYYYHNYDSLSDLPPTPEPTATNTPTPTFTATYTPSLTPVISLTPSHTPTPSVTPVPPAVQSYAPSDDTYIKQSYPNSNYGSLKHKVT